MTKWSAVPFDESQVNSTTETVTLQNLNSNQRIRQFVPELGRQVVPVHELSDIPLVNGFRQFEQDKVYRFVEEISSSDKLLIPAGWNGYIVGMHNPLTKYDYAGTGDCLQTLGLSGAIDSVADLFGNAGVVTVASHTLLAGQYVNITGVSVGAYNVQKALILSVSPNFFELDIPFTSPGTGGDFDTGYDAVNLMNMAFTNDADTATWLNVDAATTSSVFRYNNVKSTGFINPGSIKGGTIIGYDGNFEFDGDPLTLEDVVKATISTTTLTNTNPGAGNAALLDFFGSLIGDIALDHMQFNVGLATQFPLSIDPAIIGPISIINSPDNNIATDYFDTGGGLLDQTDPRVFTFNNGLRANSMTESESRSVGVLVVDGSGGVAVPIEDLTPAPGDFILDSASQEFSIDTSTGLVTYDGLAPKTVLIGYSLEAAQSSGSAQDLVFDLRINGVQQAKTIRTMTTMGVGSFITVVLVGGLFTINPGDTFKLFKENTSNTNNTDVQNTILLIR